MIDPSINKLLASSPTMLKDRRDLSRFYKELLGACSDPATILRIVQNQGKKQKVYKNVGKYLGL